MELPRESSIMHAESLNDSNRHNMRSLLHNFPFHREALFIVNNLLIKKLKSLQVELESRIYMWTSQRVASRGSFRKRPTSHTLKKSRQPEWVVINYASLNCLTSDYRKWTERAKLNWTVGYGQLDMSARSGSWCNHVKVNVNHSQTRLRFNRHFYHRWWRSEDHWNEVIHCLNNFKMIWDSIKWSVCWVM